VTEVFHLCHRR